MKYTVRVCIFPRYSSMVIVRIVSIATRCMLSASWCWLNGGGRDDSKSKILTHFHSLPLRCSRWENSVPSHLSASAQFRYVLSFLLVCFGTRCAVCIWKHVATSSIFICSAVSLFKYQQYVTFYAFVDLLTQCVSSFYLCLCFPFPRFESPHSHSFSVRAATLWTYIALHIEQDY